MAKNEEQKAEGEAAAVAEAADGPLLDLTDAAVKRMIKIAKKRGWVTQDELNAVLPSEEISSDQIEDMNAMLSEMGINVVETEDAEEAEKEPAETPEEEEPEPGVEVVETSRSTARTRKGRLTSGAARLKNSNCWAPTTSASPRIQPWPFPMARPSWPAPSSICIASKKTPGRDRAAGSNVARRGPGRPGFHDDVAHAQIANSWHTATHIIAIGRFVHHVARARQDLPQARCLIELRRVDGRRMTCLLPYGS